nr:HAD family hydrolase [uncultured Draconibacterium sp.]
MRNIKAVIFDLDGTLGNTIPLCIEAFRNAIEPLINKELSDQEITSTFGPSEEGTIKALVPDDSYNKGISDYLDNYEKLHERCPRPFDGIISLLDGLKSKQIRIAMVTGKGKYSTKITLQRFGITHFFERIETGHSEGASKPEGIQSVLDYYKELSQNEVIYVGDSPNDILACKKVGIPIIAAAWADTAEPEKLAELKPDKLFCSVSDFSNWIISNV